MVEREILHRAPLKVCVCVCVFVYDISTYIYIYVCVYVGVCVFVCAKHRNFDKYDSLSFTVPATRAGLAIILIMYLDGPINPSRLFSGHGT